MFICNKDDLSPMSATRVTKKKRRLFVTFEGIDGCGKSTQLELAEKYLTTLGYRVKRLREPGSTDLSEKIRKILLNKKTKISDITELFLYEAARTELIAREIAPALSQGIIVLCDRFYDSTTAYQGYGRGLDIRMVRSLHKMAVGDIHPDLTIVIDVDINTARKRMGSSLDRLESLPIRFHQKVRNGFLEIARKENRRVKLVDGTHPPDIVFQAVKKLLDRKLTRP